MNGETRAPSDAELLRWLAKTCEERYPYQNGQALIQDWRPTDDTVRPVGYGVLRQLQTIVAALTRQLEARDGYVLVPAEMTKEMALAYARGFYHDNFSEDLVFDHTPARELWAELLEAARLSSASGEASK